MILDTFVLSYKADTGEAEAKINKLDKASQDSVSKARMNAEKAIKQLNATLQEANQKANNEMDSGMSRFTQGMQNRISQLRSLAGGAVGGVAGAARGLGGALGGAAGLGPIMGTIGVLGSAAGVVAAFSAALGTATQRAKEAAQAEKHAWEQGMSTTQMLRGLVVGQRLGLTDAQTTEAMRGFHARAQQVALERRIALPGQLLSPEAIAFQKFGGKIGGDYEANLQRIIARQRAQVESGAISQGRAIQRLMTVFGVNFEFASAAIKASNEEIKNLSKNLEAETLTKAAQLAESKKLAAETKKLEDGQKKFGDTVSSKVTPALADLYGKMTKTGQNTNSLAEAIGNLGAAIARVFGGIIEKVQQLRSEAPLKALINEQYDEVYDELKKAGKSKNITMAQFDELVKQTIRERSSGIFAARESGQKAVGIDEVVNRWIKGTTKGEKPLSEEAIRKAQTMALRQGWTGTMLEQHLKEIASNTGNIQKDQTEGNADLKGIRQNTAPAMGIEQALGLWAAGVGKAAGFTPSEGFAGKTRAEYEKAWGGLRGMAGPGAVPASWMDRLEGGRKSIRDIQASLGEANTTASRMAALSSRNQVRNMRSQTNSFNSSVGNVTINTTGGNPEQIARSVTDVQQHGLRMLVNEASDARRW
ncbi:hypothetical protein [Chromobacterium haemolyticum]|uniref:Uncharacterized protein n=1 Tax=Chromobacterium haemolyticum TaxID=394935 RepID=A0A1W0D244_9NEIS|nr:hypothetical protein [Chromobacterium haemolyticum]OQS41013.1 hypothetical protein B0T45_09265 [Chromobacterium haemolyticum]